MKPYPGNYRAKLKLNDGKLFEEHSHYITIHSTGEITEFEYFSTITGEFHSFIPERVWDRSFLNSYELEML